MQPSSEIAQVVIVRDYNPGDRNFILASFLKGLYYGNEFYNMIPKAIFMAAYSPVINLLVDKSKIKVAVLKDDIDVILGYAILSQDETTLHWVKIKAAWTNKGIATMLLPSSISNYTHFTTIGLKLKHKIKAVFNPFNL